MGSKGISLAALGVTALSVLGINIAVAQEPSTDVTGCVVRFYDTGPKVHVNGSHLCPRVTSVDVDDAGFLVIRRSGSRPIQSVSASPDETLAARGIFAGASGGGSTTRVRFFDTTTGKTVRADSPALQGPRANVWLTWVS